MIKFNGDLKGIGFLGSNESFLYISIFEIFPNYK